MRIHKTSIGLLACTILFAACFGSTHKPVQPEDNSPVIGTGSLKPLPQGNELQDPVHGKPVVALYGSVDGQGGTAANGIAFLYKFSDGTYMGTVSANIAKAPQNTFYQLWLTSSGGKAAPVKAGHLPSILGDARHALRYELKNDLTGYDTLVISEETTDGASKPTKVMATSLLKTAAAPVLSH